MSNSTYRDLWRRIAQVSAPWRKLVPAKDDSPTSNPSEPRRPFPSLNLDVPTDFTAFIHDLDLPPPTFQQVLSRVHQAIDEQKNIHEAKYQELCNKFLRLNVPSTSSNHRSYFEGFKKTYEKTFQRHLNEIRETVIKRCEELRLEVIPKKISFNSDYTPVLEHYFQFNAYPSVRDRELLARKSSMTPRQIEVWFQNHRRRARKEGKQLKRITSDPLPADFSLQTLQECIPPCMLRKEERRTPSLDEKDITAAQNPKLLSPPSTPPPGPASPDFSFDNIPASSFSWPAAYSARDGATFSSTPQAFTFEAPVWYRKALLPSSSRPSSSPSIDDLCSDFRSKLHMGGAGLVRKQRNYKYTTRSVATRRRYAITPHPAILPPAVAKSAMPTPSSAEPPIEFGSATSLGSRKRHQPYDLSSRKHPNWFLDKPSKPRFTLSRPTATHHKLSSIPRTPSLASISSSDSSRCSDPPTPRDSPYSSPIRTLPGVSDPSFASHPTYDPYAFDSSTSTVVSSYPSSTERYTSYSKPLPPSSVSTSPPYSRSTAY